MEQRARNRLAETQPIVFAELLHAPDGFTPQHFCLSLTRLYDGSIAKQFPDIRVEREAAGVRLSQEASFDFLRDFEIQSHRGKALATSFTIGDVVFGVNTTGAACKYAYVLKLTAK